MDIFPKKISRQTKTQYKTYGMCYDESERGERISCLKLNIQKTKIMASGPITSREIDGETVQTMSEFFFGGGTPKSLQMVIAAMKLKDTCSLKEKL